MRRSPYSYLLGLSYLVALSALTPACRVNRGGISASSTVNTTQQVDASMDRGDLAQDTNTNLDDGAKGDGPPPTRTDSGGAPPADTGRPTTIDGNPPPEAPRQDAGGVHVLDGPIENPDNGSTSVDGGPDVPTNPFPHSDAGASPDTGIPADAPTRSDGGGGSDAALPGKTDGDPGDAGSSDALAGLSKSQAECTSRGGTYSGVPGADTCTFDCSAANSCQGPVQCPPGQDCVVTCGANSCKEAIDCSDGRTCAIHCQGASSCADTVTCAGPDCTVSCGGRSSCAKGINARAKMNTLTCDGAYSCKERVQCSGFQCETHCSGNTACAQGITTFGDTNLAECTGSMSCTGNDVQCTGNTCRLVCSNYNGTCITKLTCFSANCSYF